MTYSRRTTDTLARNDFYLHQGQLAERGYRLSVASNKFGQLRGYRVTFKSLPVHPLNVVDWSEVKAIHNDVMSVPKPKLGSLAFAL